MDSFPVIWNRILLCRKEVEMQESHILLSVICAPILQDIHVFLFSKAFRADKRGKLIQSISQRAKRTGITAEMASEQNGNDQQ